MGRFMRGGLAEFGSVGGYLAGVDRSGRGFNPRPALLPTGSAGPDSLTNNSERHRVRA